MLLHKSHYKANLLKFEVYDSNKRNWHYGIKKKYLDEKGKTLQLRPIIIVLEMM